MNTKRDFTITEHDGPKTCLWKIMQGRDWTTTAELIEALKHTRYSASTYKALLSSTKVGFLERIEHPMEHGRVGRKYRLIEGAPKPPRENVKITSKERQAKVGNLPRFSTYGASTSVRSLAISPWDK